ncbi:MAG TPA: hypothetical protein VGP92_13415 [Acidimicrobiia bacterium]|nr:hypothetical protein [Acidimicrobiia bacterium]
MASQLRFEGGELDELLERVRTEVGPEARIVAANRIRQGGIAGFFAREGYEVVVDADRANPNGGNRPPRGRRRGRADAPTEPAAAPEPERASARNSTSVLDLVEEVNEIERDQVIDLAEAPMPTLSTERRDFGEMLANLTRELDEEEASMPTVTDGPISPSAHYRRVTNDPAAAAPQPAPAAAAVHSAIAPMPAATAAPSLLPQADARLLALGLPMELAPSTAVTGDLRTALCQRLAQLPPPPVLPRTTGVVIAIVGIGTAPIALARRLADELDIDPQHVLLATPEAMSDVSHPEEAEAFRRSCRRRAEPTIVACSIGSGRAQLGWAHRILDRLEPTITWAVVDASVKAEDVGHRITLLGGVDVIALTGIADTVSPAAILGLNIPIGRIGSNPATPAVWADLLMERLER